MYKRQELERARLVIDVQKKSLVDVRAFSHAERLTGCLLEALAQLEPVFGVKEGCALLGLPRATVYWLRRPKTEPVKGNPRADPANSLSPEERRHFLGLAHSVLFIDKTPYEIYYSLLDQGEYLCSPSTMYRILRESGEVRERRDQRRLPTYRYPVPVNPASGR